jgi:NaMN:DMB phosphoribosyltransferase
MFFLVIGGTKTIKHPGISAAGASHELLPYTAALDAEYICLGKTLSLDSIPVSPAGIVSPALISRKCLELLKMPVRVINAGAPVTPQLSDEWMTDLGALPAESVVSSR